MTMLPIIEKGIPLPKQRKRYQTTGDNSRFIQQLVYGDSFKVDTNSERHQWISLAKLYGMRMVSEKINGEGYRIWRIA